MYGLGEVSSGNRRRREGWDEHHRRGVKRGDREVSGHTVDDDKELGGGVALIEDEVPFREVTNLEP